MKRSEITAGLTKAANTGITPAEYRRRFADYIRQTGKPYKQLDDYAGAGKKLRFKCSIHGVFEKLPRLVISGAGCQKCSQIDKYAAKHRQNEDDYVDFLHKRRLKISQGYSESGRLLHTCLTCENDFMALEVTIRSGRGCPHCEGRPILRTHRQYNEATFRAELRQRHPKLRLKPGTFHRLGREAIFRCTAHGIFTRTASSVLARGCTDCNRQESVNKLLLDRRVWEERIRALHGDTVRLLGQYLGTNKNRRYRFKCYTCLNTWKAQLPSVGQRGTGCPHCVNQRKTKFNSRVKVFERDGVTFRVEGWEYQAIAWLLDNKNLSASDILTESSSKVPVIPYRFGRRARNYYPDLFIPKWNRIVEVKSGYTLGLTGGRRAVRNWRQNQAKALAVLAAGYKYTLLLIDKDGTRRMLPSNWYEMSIREVSVWMAFHNADNLPIGIKPLRRKLSHKASKALAESLQIEKDTPQ